MTVRPGVSLIESLLAVALFALLVTALVGAIVVGRESAVVAGARGRAVLLAEEGVEAARNMRDAAFSNLGDGTHGLMEQAGVWVFSGLSDTINGFTRAVTIASAGTNRKTVTGSIAWQQTPSRTGSATLVTQMTNWRAHVREGWRNPTVVASINAAGGQTGLKVQGAGATAYLVRDDGTPDFLILDMTNPDSPSLMGSLDLSGTPTNIAVSGGYAYVTGTANAAELQIIDITTPASPSIIGTYNAPGNADANGIAIAGTTVYLVRSSSADHELLAVNVGTPTSPTLLGALGLGATGNEVAVFGSHAYVASEHNSRELDVISIATPSSPVRVGVLDLSGATDAQTIAVSGSLVLLGRGNTLHTINVTTPTAPSALGAVDLGGTVRDVAFGGADTLAFVGTSAFNAEFQVLDLAVAAAPTSIGVVDVIGGASVHGIAYQSAWNRAIGASTEQSMEFIVFAPE